MQSILESADGDDLLQDIDWEHELKSFSPLEYPDYYDFPFHSVSGGWLSIQAAMFNKVAMQSIYAETHPESYRGLRQKLAKKFVPASTRVLIDLGAGDGFGTAEFAKALPGARIIAVDASPHMIIVGRLQNADVPNLEWRHCLAERTGLPRGIADVVSITLVLHECSDQGKTDILREAHALLRPGGTLVVADTPRNELGTFRGFFEPHLEAWRHFDLHSALLNTGFQHVSSGYRTLQSKEEERPSSVIGVSSIFIVTAIKDIKSSL